MGGAAPPVRGVTLRLCRQSAEPQYSLASIPVMVLVLVLGSPSEMREYRSGFTLSAR